MTGSVCARIVLAALLMAGCGPAEEDLAVTQSGEPDVAAEGEAEEPGLADVELCDAEDYRPLIGSNMAGAALPEDPMLRAFGENDIITQDYRPQRTNILYDAKGTILKVYCG